MRRKGIFEFQQFTIDQSHAAMKVGTDSDLLGTMAAGGRHILDIGTGTGIISLMLAQRFPDARITAVEIDDNAIIDARTNFAASPFADRLELVHASFQDYHAQLLSQPDFEPFDCVVCNPPYFDKSLECDDLGRLRARHSSSLPFPVLIGGAYDLLSDGGLFSVCIPPEVLELFCAECLFKGFSLEDNYQIRSIPEKEPKRYVLVHKKGTDGAHREHFGCMRNSDRSRSDWYKELMREFHVMRNE